METGLCLILTTVLLCTADSAPATTSRKAKNLGYLEYIQPDAEYGAYDLDNDDYVSMALEENEISRSIPATKPHRQFNSPIYYIRLPPQPYMFVPGLGYVSQPSPSQVSQFVNVQMPFVANGKPSNIYQWSSAFQGFQTEAPPRAPTFHTFPTPDPSTNSFHNPTSSGSLFSGFPKPQKPTKKPLADSTIYRLPGTFSFNGKPEDIFVLRDSYNSLFNDVLQNVYP